MTELSFSTPEEVEAAFYDAIARADLEAMMAVWAEEDEVVCVHPGGTRHIGLAAVRDGWQELFASGTRLLIRCTDVNAIVSMVQVVHHQLEHVAVQGEHMAATQLVATNVFTRGVLGWRMVLHHVSPLTDGSSEALPDLPRTLH